MSRIRGRYDGTRFAKPEGNLWYNDHHQFHMLVEKRVSEELEAKYHFQELFAKYGW